jgi:hypothetical protein
MLQAALASGDSVAQAAVKAKLSERTVYRRLKETAFQRAILSLRAEAVERTSALLNAASVLATKTLIELLHESIPPTVRRGASRDIIVLGGKTYEQVIQDKRLTALEQSLTKRPLETPWRLAS